MPVIPQKDILQAHEKGESTGGGVR